jgi:internalin A
VTAAQCKLDDLPGKLIYSPALWFLSLKDARILGIPQEILDSDNCLESLRDHLADLSVGEHQVRDVKVIILGNGRVGKTQLCGRLRGEPFDANGESTHGISVERVPLSKAPDAPLLNLWDFGGQDIYHGTHALFMATRAVFVVVWHPDFERNDEVTEAGHMFRNHALPYWIEYVRNLGGKRSPIVLVQSRCDTPDVELSAFPVLHVRAFPDLPTMRR